MAISHYFARILALPQNAFRLEIELKSAHYSDPATLDLVTS